MTRDDIRCYGPFRSMSRMLEAVRTLNDLLGLRDCAATMPVVFAGQGDLFEAPQQAGCMRHELGFCSGPCAGLVAEWDYRQRVETAMAFLEGRTIQPIDRVVAAMQEASGKAEFEIASLAVSALTGCEMCVKSHEHSLVELGVGAEKVHDAVRIAAVLHGAAISRRLTTQAVVG